jgi:hypothetical protein
VDTTDQGLERPRIGSVRGGRNALEVSLTRDLDGRQLSAVAGDHLADELRPRVEVAGRVAVAEHEVPGQVR